MTQTQTEAKRQIVEALAYGIAAGNGQVEAGATDYAEVCRLFGASVIDAIIDSDSQLTVILDGDVYVVSVTKPKSK